MKRLTFDNASLKVLALRLMLWGFYLRYLWESLAIKQRSAKTQYEPNPDFPCRVFDICGIVFCRSVYARASVVARFG